MECSQRAGRSFTDNFPFCRVISPLEIASNWSVWRCQCDCLVPVIFIQGACTPHPALDYKTQEHAEEELCLRQCSLPPSAVAAGWRSGFTYSVGTTSQTLDTTQGCACLPRVTFVFDGCRPCPTKLEAAANVQEHISGSRTTELAYLNMQRSVAKKRRHLTHFKL